MCSVEACENSGTCETTNRPGNHVLETPYPRDRNDLKHRKLWSTIVLFSPERVQIWACERMGAMTASGASPAVVYLTFSKFQKHVFWRLHGDTKKWHETSENLIHHRLVQVPSGSRMNLWYIWSLINPPTVEHLNKNEPKNQDFWCHQENCASMTTLISTKLVENKCSRTSRLSRLVVHKKLCRVDFSKTNSTVGYQSFFKLRLHVHICAQPTFDAKSPLAHKQLLYEVPSLRSNSATNMK